MNNMDRFKFRFYHFEDEKMYNVIQLCAKMPNEDFLRVFLDKPIKNKNQFTNWKTGIDGVLVQSTSLKDKNGNLIHEGDIIEIIDVYTSLKYTSTCKVIWDNSKFELEYIKKSHNNVADELFWYVIYERRHLYSFNIIGNIYENSDLLKTTNGE